MTAVVIIPHDVSAFEAAPGDVMQTVGDVNSVEARHSLHTDRLVLRLRPSSGSGVQIPKKEADRSVFPPTAPLRPFFEI